MEQVLSKNIKTMTVGELKQYLEEFPDSAKVVFAYPSGDYWHTELIGEINYAEYASVKYTEYHRCFKVMDTEDEDGQEVLVLGK
jgi:hypothetical protein